MSHLSIMDEKWQRSWLPTAACWSFLRTNDQKFTANSLESWMLLLVVCSKTGGPWVFKSWTLLAGRCMKSWCSLLFNSRVVTYINWLTDAVPTPKSHGAFSTFSAVAKYLQNTKLQIFKTVYGIYNLQWKKKQVHNSRSCR